MFPETEKTSHFKNRKESLALDVPKIDTLLFPILIRPTSESKANTKTLTEAFVVADDSIYLFTKQWKQKRTAVYALPKFRKSCRPAERILQYKGLLPAPFCHTKKLLL
jgi:hypothetical protein